MSRSSEEVLLIVHQVKHKKSDGALYMMSQRMAWMQASKTSFTTSHNYADIKCNYIIYSHTFEMIYSVNIYCFVRMESMEVCMKFNLSF